MEWTRFGQVRRPGCCRLCTWQCSWTMSDATVENLILNLLEWLADGDRSYEDVISAWRTSCPRLPVWEDANDRGLVTVVEVNGRCMVRITRLGLALLDRPIQEPGSSRSSVTQIVAKES